MNVAQEGPVGIVTPAQGAVDYRALYFRDFTRLTRLAYFLGSEDPEDVVQEAFARLHARWVTIRNQDAAGAYLYTTVARLVSSRRRHLAVAAKAAPRLAVTAESATEPSMAAVEESTLLALIRGLPRRQREVVVMRYWLDLSERSIAETLGISVGAVKTHAARAMASLKVGMGGHRD